METSKCASRLLGVLALGAAVAGCAGPTTTETHATAYPVRVTGTAPVVMQSAPVVTEPATTTTIFIPHSTTTVATAAASAPPAVIVSPTDAELMMHAAQDSMAEVRLAQLAQQRAGTDAVRQLAQRIVLDHTNADAELFPLARQRGVALAPSLHPEHQAMEQRLAYLSGTQFDVAFLEYLIGDHARSVAMFERAAATATDSALRSWAARQLPILRHHQAMAQNLHAQLARTAPYPSASPLIPLR
jgi:putative membrane protein